MVTLLTLIILVLFPMSGPQRGIGAGGPDKDKVGAIAVSELV
jgi:hypothetical protein